MIGFDDNVDGADPTPESRARRRRGSRTALGIVLFVVLVIVWLVYVAYSGLQVNDHLRNAKGLLPQIQAQVKAGDISAAQTTMQTFASEAKAADHYAGGVAWRAAEYIPVVGDDLTAARLVSDALNGIGTSASSLLDKGSPLKALTPHHGRFNLAAIKRVSGDLTNLANSVDHSDTEMTRFDTSGLLGIVRTKFVAAQQELHGIRPGLDILARTAAAAPDLLGAHGIRHYALIFNNNAEIRATGGLPGVWADVTAKNGKVEITRTGGDTRFRQLTPSGAAAIGLKPAPSEVRLYYYTFVTLWVNANYTPDFGLSSRIWATRWQQRFGTHLDGVIGVDTVTLGYLLTALGPIDVDGIHITPQNANYALLNEPYTTLGPRMQDAYFQDVANTVSERLMGGSPAPGPLLSVLGLAMREGRLHFHSFRNLGLPALPTPQVGLYLYNASGNKMDYYLRERYALTSESCDNNEQQLHGSVLLKSYAPANMDNVPWFVTGGLHPPYVRGTHFDAIQIWAPRGGRISDVMINGTPAQFVRHAVIDGRQVFWAKAVFPPSKSARLTWRMTSPDKGDLLVEHTPGMDAQDARFTVRSACH